MVRKKGFTLDNYIEKFESYDKKNNWQRLIPNEWDTMDYASYMYNTGLTDHYYNFYNCIDDDGKSYGHRYPSLNVSRAWGVESGFLTHACKKHDYKKHSVISLEEPALQWICPFDGNKTQIPHRHTYPGSNVFINYDIDDKYNGIFQILQNAYKTRSWHFEMCIIKNEFRGLPTYPDDHIKLNNKDEKWERVRALNNVMEFDTTRETGKGGKRRDFMEKGDMVIINTQKIIDIINSKMDDVGIEEYEFWFSGDGLYFIMNNGFNDESLKDKDVSNVEWFNHRIKCWEKYQNTFIKPLLKENKVRYIELDDRLQHIRLNYKAPFSLNRRYDRIVLPLTAFFDGNDKIDLSSSGWRKYIYPRYIHKKFVSKIFSKVNI